MDILVQRKWFTPQSTCGEMSLDGEFFCYTLEPRFDQSAGKPFAIPAGIYQVTLAQSHRFNMITPHVNDVPGFIEIEIHPGNYPRDTEGCCLVGDSRMVDFIGNSRKTFEALMEKFSLPCNITYAGNPSS